MLSLEHEFLVDLFRQRPVLALELLRACAGIDLETVTVEPGSIDLSQVVPTEYRSDALSVARDERGEAVAAVIAEVQLQTDADKRRTWPLYVAAARASLRCPVILLVLAPDPAVARWASEPIELGHPGFCLRPLAAGTGQIPRITDEAAARAAPELAVLSTLAHPELEVARVALASVDGLSEDRKKLYWDVIRAALPALVRQALEASMIRNHEYKTNFARNLYAEGHEEGLEKGREEGLRSAIVELVSARMPGLRDELVSRLRDQREDSLVRLAALLGKAPDEESVRAALDQLDARS